MNKALMNVVAAALAGAAAGAAVSAFVIKRGKCLCPVIDLDGMTLDGEDL